MRIGVITPQPTPPVAGGLERALARLVAAFREHTPHEAELVAVPVRERTLPEIVDAYATFANLDVGRFDLVITSKYPAWLVRHPEHVVYMFHRLRGLYDTYHVFGLPPRVDLRDPDLAAFQRLLRAPARRDALPAVFDAFGELLARRGPRDPAFAFPGPLARELVHFLDAVALDPDVVRRFFALSQTVAARPGYFPPGARVEVVYTPPFSHGVPPRAHRHFFTVSRLDGPKRIDAVIRAMDFVSRDVPLLIAGSGPQLEALRELAAPDPRVSFLGSVSDHELDELYADAIAVPFVPRDEDLGLVALEAMARAKPVVTARDSGGPTEFVRDLSTGLVTDPLPSAIGAALERLAGDQALALRLGVSGSERVRRLTWERTARALLRAPRATTRDVPRRGARRHAVVLSTHSAARNGHGGQQRLYHLACGLAKTLDVEILVLGEDVEIARTQTLVPGLRQSIVPKSPAQVHGEGKIGVASGGAPIEDIAASILATATPRYVDTVRERAAAADCVILAQPYLLPAVTAARVTAPLIFESHNVEVALKHRMLPPVQARDALVDIVARVEAEAVRTAVLTTTCSEADARGLASEYGVDELRFTVIPNGVDIEATPFVDLRTRRRHRDRWLDAFEGEARVTSPIARLAIFLGSGHPPNIDAARSILAFAPSRPETLFALAGSHSSRLEYRSLPPNVVALGPVSETTKAALLASADVALNPMGLGSGTNVKMVEYLAAGAPVVSTAVGARGLLTDDPPFVVADVSRFAAAIGAVYADPLATERRVERGRAVAEQELDWKVLGTRFAQAVSAAIAA